MAERTWTISRMVIAKLFYFLMGCWLVSVVWVVVAVELVLVCLLLWCRLVSMVCVVVFFVVLVLMCLFLGCRLVSVVYFEVALLEE